MTAPTLQPMAKFTKAIKYAIKQNQLDLHCAITVWCRLVHNCVRKLGLISYIWWLVRANYYLRKWYFIFIWSVRNNFELKYKHFMHKVTFSAYWPPFNIGLFIDAGTQYHNRCTLLSCDQAALRTYISVCPSVCPSVTPFWQCSCHCFILKFSGDITIDRRDVHAKGQGQRSMSQRSVWIHIWRWNGAQRLMLLRRGAFQDHPSNFKVTRLKQLSILTQIGSLRTVTPVWIHQWLWNDAQILKQHKRCALLFFKVNHRFSQSHGTKKITNFDPNCAFPDCNSSLNVPMALKCYIKLNVV